MFRHRLRLFSRNDLKGPIIILPLICTLHSTTFSLSDIKKSPVFPTSLFTSSLTSNSFTDENNESNEHRLNTRDTAVFEYSYHQYAANEPIEDRIALHRAGDKMIASLMDGHGGWQASDYAMYHLPRIIEAEFQNCQDSDDVDELSSAIVRGYERTDRDFISKIRSAFEVGFGSVAHVGACAISAVVTPTSVVVANAGDCRAVLGRVSTEQFFENQSSAHSSSDEAAVDVVQATSTTTSSSSPSSKPLSEDELLEQRMQRDLDALSQRNGAKTGNEEPSSSSSSSTSASTSHSSTAAATTSAPRTMYLQTTELSSDHNARMPREQLQLRLSHPNEPDVVYAKPNSNAYYVKARLQPTRGLGDAYLKYSEFNAPANNRIRGRHIPAPYTPPYVTAKPEVKSIQIDTASESIQQQFLVLACDGVWDVLTSEEVVSFIAKDNGPKSTVASRLGAHVLSREAYLSNTDVSSLMALPPGKQRRQMHDDISILVLWLGKKQTKLNVEDNKPKKDAGWFSRWFK
jgi:serine/threonine protein phosphatase PrpC